MENSTAYKNLLLQLKSDMREKHSGYYSGLFEDIYDWEREEVEKTIIQAFEKEGVTQFANYFPTDRYRKRFTRNKAEKCFGCPKS